MEQVIDVDMNELVNKNYRKLKAGDRISGIKEEFFLKHENIIISINIEKVDDIEKRLRIAREKISRQNLVEVDRRNR